MLRRKITYKPLAFLIAVLFLPTVLPAQSTRVRGRVTDAADGTPMQFGGEEQNRDEKGERFV